MDIAFPVVMCLTYIYHRTSLFYRQVHHVSCVPSQRRACNGSLTQLEFCTTIKCHKTTCIHSRGPFLGEKFT